MFVNIKIENIKNSKLSLLVYKSFKKTISSITKGIKPMNTRYERIEEWGRRNESGLLTGTSP